MSSNAQLVLLTGSSAGLVAAIHPGYYLVGRSSHCQIRPKTRSVSRQHCLLYFGSGDPEPIDDPEINEEVEVADAPRRIHVMDLGSASGTRIDGKKVSVREWRQVPSGGELRCGKIAWRAVVNAYPQPITPPLKTRLVKRPRSEHDAIRTDDPVAVAKEAPQSVLVTESTSEGADDCVVEIVKGQAWHGEDVAAFLASHDEVDRKQRREKILATVQRKEARSNGFGLAHETHVDPADEEELETNVPGPSSSKQARSENPQIKRPRNKSRRNKSPTASSSGSGQSKGVATEKRKRALAIPRPTWDTVKLALALALTIAVIGFGVYQIILFRSGPPVRVYRGIGWKSHEAYPLWVCCGAVGASETHESTRYCDKA